MLVYPGGAVYEPGSDHYLFRNFFSDLGATSTPLGTLQYRIARPLRDRAWLNQASVDPVRTNVEGDR
jgi:hypothetical protein